MAVGGNLDAALANGISPTEVKTKAFVLCSGLAGLAGILVVCQEGSVYSTSGAKMELETIAAAVSGGCTLLSPNLGTKEWQRYLSSFTKKTKTACRWDKPCCTSTK